MTLYTHTHTHINNPQCLDLLCSCADLAFVIWIVHAAGSVSVQAFV